MRSALANSAQERPTARPLPARTGHRVPPVQQVRSFVPRLGGPPIVLPAVQPVPATVRSARRVQAQLATAPRGPIPAPASGPSAATKGWARSRPVRLARHGRKTTAQPVRRRALMLAQPARTAHRATVPGLPLRERAEPARRATSAPSPPGTRPARAAAVPATSGPQARAAKLPVNDDDLGPIRPPNLHIEEVPYSDRPSPSRPPSGRSSGPRPGGARPYSDRPSTGRPSAPRSYSDRPSSGRPSSGRPSQGRPDFDRPRPSSDRPRSDRPRPSSGRPAPSRPSRPFSSEGGLPRAYTTSSGMPRAGGPRPSSKPGKPAGRSYSPGSGSRPGPGSIDARTGSGYRPSAAPRSSRPYTPRIEGASVPHTKKFSGGTSRGTGSRGESAGGARGSDTGWKPKTRYGGPKKPGTGGYSKPGGPSKGAHKGKPGGKRPSSPGGKKRG